MGFKENLKKYRKLHNLTQKKLADKIGKKPLTISRYENGEIFPPVEVIEKIANIFNMPVEKLVLSENQEHTGISTQVNKDELHISTLFAGQVELNDKSLKELKYLENLLSKNSKNLYILLEIQKLEKELKNTITRINQGLDIKEDENRINDRVKKIIEYFIFLLVIENRINLKEFDNFI